MNDNFIPVKSATRALEIIDLLARQPDGMSFSRIQELTGWPSSSVYNLLRTMASSGHLEFSEQERVYRVGIRLWEAGQTYLRTRDLSRIGSKYLTRAAQTLNETAQLAILDGLENVYVAKIDVDHHLKLASEVGSRLPAHATGLGKVLLAGLDEEELARRLDGHELRAFTEKTIMGHDALKLELERIRHHGYAVDSGEYTAGVFCVAVPIFDSTGHVIAAMSSSAPEVRVTEELRTTMRETLSREAESMSIELGYSQSNSLEAV